MRRGLIYGTLAYGLWGLFPFFFKQLQHVASLQVVLHRMVWSLVFVLLLLAVLRRWAWLGDVPCGIGTMTTLAIRRRALLGEVEAIEGVLDAEARIVKLGLLDLPGMVEPGSVLFVSLPEPGGLNRLYLRRGRLPEPLSAAGLLISAAWRPLLKWHRGQ